MQTNEVWNLINKDLLEKVYRYAYRRCNTSHEAEDLCSKIVLRILQSLKNQKTVEHFYAFVWTVARRVYADHCAERNRECQNVSYENADSVLGVPDDGPEDILAQEEDAAQLNRILYEITFLSKAYRDVMVMHYIEEVKIKDIAAKLCISETTVKQRLFSARNEIRKNEIRKEVRVMKDQNLTLQPIRLAISGTGNPMGNDPRTKTERMFSQNLIYLCKDKPKTAKELAEELCVPMPYVEEELEIQVRGENGKYGMLRKLPNGKYTTNVLVVDYREYDEVNGIYEKHLPKISRALRESLEKYKDMILSFPYLSRQDDIRFILWLLISRTFWSLGDDITKRVKEKYFFDIVPVSRPFSTVAVAYRDGEECNFGFTGCDGNTAEQLGGYRSVFISNMYGNGMKKHFHCGHNLSQDPKILMLLRSIGGLRIGDLNEEEKEIAAKAVECGYLRKNGELLEPKVIALREGDAQAFFAFRGPLSENMDGIKEAIADEVGAYMKAHIPAHLAAEYEIYARLIAGARILSGAIEQCIKDGLLTKPKEEPCAEGVLLVVEK